jgi:hypothetical protein
MKKFALTILAAGAAALGSSAAFAGPVAPSITDGSNALVHKTGGVYLEFGGPRYYGYGNNFYYDRYPAYRYGYYGPRRYYGYGYDDYRPYKYSRRWTRERFQHPLGRR